MAISLVDHNTLSYVPPTPNPHTIPVTCSIGDVIYVLASTNDMSAPSLTGETFSVVSVFNTTTLYRCVATANHTASLIGFTSSTFTPHGAIMAAFTGVNGSVNTFGSLNSATGSSGPASASVTTANPNSLIVLFVETTPTFTFSAGSGYTIIDNLNFSVAEAVDEEANSVTPSSGTVVTPTMTLSGSGGWWAMAVSLSPSGSGGHPNPVLVVPVPPYNSWV